MIPAMRTLLGLVLALGIAGCEWVEQPGPRLRRECGSLVDELLKQDKTVPTTALVAEFNKIPGVGPLPPRPVYPSAPTRADYPRGTDHDLYVLNDDGTKPGSPRAKYLADVEAYKAAFKVWDGKLDELIAAHPEVWNRLFQERREKAINECLVRRAAKEGAAIESK
jgi:hypothetical protein